jgi:tRNA(Arg) A34 adenosine deaminase TadA
MATDEALMSIAISKAVEGIRHGQLPFGACIAKDGTAISFAHNTLLKDANTTAHAEINAIREACKKLDTIDLSGCTIYCTCEPCPMCISACSLSNISKIVYGARIGDVNLEGFTILETPEEIIDIICDGKIEVIGGFMREENLGLFNLWQRRNEEINEVFQNL